MKREKKIKSICIYYTNIIFWFLLKILPIKKKIKNDVVLIVPPDSWSVWGSRGDEAMLEVVINKYKERHANNFIIFVSSHAMIANNKHENCKYFRKWYPHFPIFGLYKAINQIKPHEVVVLGADCMDGYYSPLNTLTRLICLDLCNKYEIPYNIIGFSFNKNPNKHLLLPYKLVSKDIIFKLRDPISLRRFETFTNRKAQQVADSAFLLLPNGKCEEIKSLEKNILSLRKKKEKFIVGFNFHPMLLENATEATLNKATKVISGLLAEILTVHTNISLVLIPHDDRGNISDCNTLKSIAEEITKMVDPQRIIYINKVYHASQIKYIAGLFDMLICGRMHLAIAALGMGVPVMTANYQGKFTGLFELFNLPNKYILDFNEFCSHTLVERFDNFYHEYDYINNLVKQNKNIVLKLSSNNFNKIKQSI